MKFLFSIALPLYALDQATKWWILARSHHTIGWHETVISHFFDLCYLANTGAAFSMFRDNNAFFIGLSIVALIALLIFYARGAFPDQPSRWGAALLLSGILGNLTDRLIHGHVVDFLLFDLHIRYANPWPAFNVADSCICTATGLFIFAAFLQSPKPAGEELQK